MSTVTYGRRPPQDRLCCNCGERVARPGWPRCIACHSWYYQHDRAERPLRPLRVSFAGPCRNCGWAAGPFTQERCRACYCYIWRTGHDRPAELWSGARRPCQTCGGPTEPTAGRQCHACRGYRARTGRERPAHLWGRRIVRVEQVA